MARVLDSVAAEFEAAGLPLTIGQLTQRVRERGVWQSRSKTPAATIEAALSFDIKHNPGSRFVRTAPRTYGLRAWSPAPPVPRPNSRPTTPKAAHRSRAASEPIEALPVNVVVPESPGPPIVVYDPQAGLRIAIVERAHATFLDESWDRAGVYVLLWPTAAEPDGPLPVYVGEASAGLRSRLFQHVATKEGWRRAVLIARDTRWGLNAAQVRWLEGHLWGLADRAARVRPTNKVEPADHTLPDFDRLVLESVAEPILRVMRLLGYPLDPPGPQPSRRRRYYGATVSDLIRAGTLSAGAELVLVAPHHRVTGTVLVDGRLSVAGTTHETPSAAAKAVLGRSANGWDLWAKADQDGRLVSLASLRGDG